MLLDYEHHAGPTSHKNILSLFHSFAKARGWAVDDYRTGVRWEKSGAKYEWVPVTSGNIEDFLQISSTGFGSQNMVFRFRFEGDGSDPQAEKVTITGIDPGHTGLDDSSSTHPVLQHAYTHSYIQNMTMSPGTTPGVWFFGNKKYLIAICRHTTELWIGWYVGTIELFDPTETDAYWCVTSSYMYGHYYKWYDAADNKYYFLAPWNNIVNYDSWWWGGAGRGQTRSYPDSLTSGNTYIANNLNIDVPDNPQGVFDRQISLLQSNQYAGRRMLIKPTFYASRASDRNIFPLGTLPFYYLEYTGYNMGDKIIYGNEEYLVFPNVFQSRRYGNAFRIA